MQSECSYIKKKNSIKCKINIHLFNIYLLVLVAVFFFFLLTSSILQSDCAQREQTGMLGDISGAPFSRGRRPRLPAEHLSLGQ